MFVFFFNDTATTEIYTLSLHDALPILMVSPAAAAYLLTKELHWMMTVGAGLGVLSCLTGMYISYYIDTPSGPAIALTLFACFLLALLFSPSQGILTRGRGQSKG